jgi:hypothetical protein
VVVVVTLACTTDGLFCALRAPVEWAGSVGCARGLLVLALPPLPLLLLTRLRLDVGIGAAGVYAPG